MGQISSSDAAEISADFDNLTLSNQETAYPDSDGESYLSARCSHPATTFPRFAELCVELQIAIFQQAILACPKSHELEETMFLFTTPRWVGTRSPPILISPYTKRIVYGHPFVYKERKDIYALMATCRLSRQMVLEWWVERVAEGPRGYSAEKSEVKERMVDVLGELLRQMKNGTR